MSVLKRASTRYAVYESLDSWWGIARLFGARALWRDAPAPSLMPVLKVTPPRPMAYAMLDAWRGFASLWVVLLHAAVAGVAIQDSMELQRKPLFAFSIMGSLGVQLFFVISGFCIANAAVSAFGRDRGHWKFVKARFRRIYPPYLATSLLAAALSMLAGWLVSRGYLHSSSSGRFDVLGQSLKFYVAAITLTQIPLGEVPILIVFWTLCYEIAFYLIVFVALIVVRFCGGGVRGLLNGLHSLTILVLLTLIWQPQHQVFPFSLWPQFGIGVLTFDLLMHARDLRPRLFGVAVSLLALLLASLYNHYSGLVTVGTRGQIVTCLLFMGTLLLLYPFDAHLMRSWPVRLLGWLGSFSYSVYLTHPIAQGLVLQGFRKFRPITSETLIYVFWLQVVAAIACAYVFYWVFERPFARGSRNRVTRSNAAQHETEANPHAIQPA
jgi:exopolysaccharide production protein ExoZ